MGKILSSYLTLIIIATLCVPKVAVANDAVVESKMTLFTSADQLHTVTVDDSLNIYNLRLKGQGIVINLSGENGIFQTLEMKDDSNFFIDGVSIGSVAINRENYFNLQIKIDLVNSNSEIVIDNQSLGNFEFTPQPIITDIILSENQGNCAVSKIEFTGADISTSTHQLSNSIVKIFPNPALDIINVDITGALEYSLNLYNVQGMRILASTNQTAINISSLIPGTYLLEITDINSGQKIFEKIVKAN